MTRSVLLSLMLFLVALPPFVWGTQSKADSDPLKRYTICKVAADLTLRDVTRVKYPGNSRAIGDHGS